MEELMASFAAAEESAQERFMQVHMLSGFYCLWLSILLTAVIWLRQTFSLTGKFPIIMYMQEPNHLLDSLFSVWIEIGLSFFLHF